MEAHDAGLEAVVLGVVPALPLAEQLLPSVTVLGIGRIGVIFLERCDVGARLSVTRVDARGARVEIPLNPIQPCGLEHVDVDQHVVVHDHSLVMLDEADAAHVGGEVVNLVDAAGRLEAVAPATQVEQLELVGARSFVFGKFDIDAADPVSAVLQVAHQVVSNEATRTSHQYTSRRAHLLREKKGSSVKQRLSASRYTRTAAVITLDDRAQGVSSFESDTANLRRYRRAACANNGPERVPGDGRWAVGDG